MKLKTRLRKKQKELELKVRRENRKYYTECMMDILAEHYVIFPSGDLCYRFVIDGENVKLWGGANKLHFYKQNIWIENADRWIIKNLLNPIGRKAPTIEVYLNPSKGIKSLTPNHSK